MMNKITEKELNEFRIKLNQLNEVLLKSSKKMVEARTLCSSGKITKQEYKDSINKFKVIKQEYNDAADNSKFLTFYNEAKEIFSKAKKTDPDYEEKKDTFLLAKQYLTLSKEAIKNKGSDGSFFKLNNTALKVDNLTFRYRDDLPIVVNNVSFEIQHGEYVAIIGHNGSGKSTLSKLLIGVLTPISGSLCYYGNYAGASNINLIRKFLGIVFQNPDNQFIGSTVRDDVAFGLENSRVDPKLMNQKINEAVKKVNMEKFLDSEPLMLSGGQKQRVAIASALALSSDILIFDEATSMLDPKGKSDVKKIMVELKETRNHTILSITHDMDEILNADKVLVMNQAQLVKFGTPADVLKDKDFLRSIHLDIPFVSQAEEAFEKQGIKVSGATDMEDLVNKICRK